MRCASCERELCPPEEAFTGDVCPHCCHLVHPTRLGIYENFELVKRGGMGVVYKARHKDLGTTVAIKIVHTHAGPETLVERFEREARLAARIPHPGVVRVFDHDCQEGRLYLVMEFVEGATLRSHIQDGRREVGWCLDKAAQLAEILQAAHDQGIVHRDIKPENVMVDKTGRVRVLDFGISRLLEEEERLTRTGEILGTPEYIAPEQILDVPEAVDGRTDIYAQGVVLYELLTGRSPFAGNNLFQVLKYVESLTPPPPSELRAGIPFVLDELVMECMAKEKEMRPATSRVLAQRLHQFEADASSGAGAGAGAGAVQRRTPVLAMAALGLLCLVSGWLLALAFGKGGAAGETGARQRVPPTPRAIIQDILAGGPPRSAVRLQTAARQIPEDASAEDFYWRGMAHKYSGALFRALRDFEVARDGGHPEAAPQAAIHWLYKHKLYPLTLLGQRWLGAGYELKTGNGDHFSLGLGALARNEYGKAAEHLEAAVGFFPDRGVLLGLSYYLEGEFRAASEAIHAAKTAHHDHVPLLILEAVFDPDEFVSRLQPIAERMDRLAPMRYFLEAALAVRGGDEHRLRAVMELATLTGEADYAGTIFLSSKVCVGLGSASTAERSHLEALGDELQGKGLPGLQVPRLYVAQAAGAASQVADILSGMSTTRDPVLSHYRTWSEALAAKSEDLPFYNGIALVKAGKSESGLQLLKGWLEKNPGAAAAGEVQLSRLWAVHALLGEEELAKVLPAQIQQGLLKLLRSGSNLKVFESHLDGLPFPPLEDGHVGVLVRVIEAGIEEKFTFEQFLPVLRLAKHYGNDLADGYEEHVYPPLRSAAQRIVYVGDSRGK